jgi:hypothetical protein
VERVSRLYEQGVDLVCVGTYSVAGNAGPGAGCRRWEKYRVRRPANSCAGYSAATAGSFWPLILSSRRLRDLE